MDAAIAVLPQAGVAGVLVLVIVYLLRANHADRTQYSQLRASEEEEHDEDIKELREENKTLRRELESERTLRRQAEEDRHNIRMELAELKRLYGVGLHERKPAD